MTTLRIDKDSDFRRKGGTAQGKRNEDSTTGHTPGPWQLSDPSYRVFTIRDDRGFHTIASVIQRKTNPDECWANARLIAAAPEMFKKLVEYAQAFPDQEALNLIAKIEGIPSPQSTPNNPHVGKE